MLCVRLPDHLGDAVMALPAVEALAAAGPVRLHGRGRWAAELFAPLPVLPAETPAEGDGGVLLKPSFGAAWRWRHLPRRVGLATAGRGWLLTDAVPVVAGEHRRDGFARVAAAGGAEARGMPVYRARGTAPPLPSPFTGLNPWSPTRTVRWPYFRALADRVENPVFFAGPGEGESVRAIAGPHPVVEGLSLPDFAAALAQCRVFVSGDSGAAHFAAACGTRVVVVHGSTAAAVTGVGEAVTGPKPWCAPCYRKTCPFGVRCLTAVEVEGVAARVAG